MPEPVTTEDVRQGRNIKGMIWVLVIGLALVVIAYMVMLVFAVEPVTVDNEPAPTAVEAPDAAAPAAAPPAETR